MTTSTTTMTIMMTMTLCPQPESLVPGRGAGGPFGLPLGAKQRMLGEPQVRDLHFDGIDQTPPGKRD